MLTEYETVTPARVSPSSCVLPKPSGSMACRPFADASFVTVKLSVPPLNAIAPKLDALRPSSQVSICLAETSGTPRARADVTTASATSD